MVSGRNGKGKNGKIKKKEKRLNGKNGKILLNFCNWIVINNGELSD
uniref:Uncharacterized protein n=1 Tax=Lepeophtheirus salmonis TaxID=72036 RepID=A0A0K2VJJ1_LEPSM